MAWFYSPGKEKIHAVGALDLALWDLKGKALKTPLHQILGGSLRDYCECYPTGGVPGAGPALKDRARAVMDAGYRAYRADAGGGPVVDNVYNSRERVRMVADACREIREGVGPKGDWCIDFHQRFDYLMDSPELPPNRMRSDDPDRPETLRRARIADALMAITAREAPIECSELT